MCRGREVQRAEVEEGKGCAGGLPWVGRCRGRRPHGRGGSKGEGVPFSPREGHRDGRGEGANLGRRTRSDRD